MDQQPENESSETKTAREMEFHFIKSNFFRVVHMDGAYGGITPSRYIQMAVYNQRQAIPQRMLEPVEQVADHIMKSAGEKKKEGKSGFVREVEVNLMMDLDTAKSVVKWLDGHIKALESILKEETGVDNHE